MIGELRYYDNVEVYAKKNQIQDFVLTYYIENMGSSKIGEEKNLVHYINRIKNKSIKFSIRKEKGCWFEVYYTGILESKKTVTGLADILSINNLFKEFLEEIKRIEYASYSKLSEDVSILKSEIMPFIQEDKFNLEAKKALNKAHESIAKIAYDLNLNKGKDLKFGLFDKHITVLSQNEDEQENIVIKFPENNQGIREIKISMDSDGEILIDI